MSEPDFKTYTARDYDREWSDELRDGFEIAKHFAWLMIASHPEGNWPSWVNQYLVQTAKRILETAVKNPKSGVMTKDEQRTFSLLELKDPRRSARIIEKYVEELELYQANPKATMLARFEGRDPPELHRKNVYKRISGSDDTQKSRSLSQANRDLEVPADTRGLRSEIVRSETGLAKRDK